MRVEDHGLVFDASEQPPEERVAAFVSLCPLRSGAILCSFQLGPSKNASTSTLRLCRSRDGGRTWDELPASFERTLSGVPGSLAAGEIVEVEPGKLLLFTTWFDRSDPDRPLFDPESQGILHCRQLMAVSTDEGESWSSWRELPTPGLTGCAITGPVLRWADGTIAFAFESYKEFDDPAPARHGAWLLVSRDGGKTFEAPHLVARHPRDEIYYWDQRLCPSSDSPDGDFVGLFWTHDLKREQDLTVHIRRTSVADDDLERTPITATGIPGQIAAPLVLPDGRLLAFVVDRGDPSTMTLWQSPDGARSWNRKDALVVYTHDESACLSQTTTDVDFNQYWEDMGKWTFGHPAICPLDEDSVLLVYYAGTPERLSVHWARVNVRRAGAPEAS